MRQECPRDAGKRLGFVTIGPFKDAIGPRVSRFSEKVKNLLGLASMSHHIVCRATADQKFYILSPNFSIPLVGHPGGQKTRTLVLSFVDALPDSLMLEVWKIVLFNAIFGFSDMTSNSCFLVLVPNQKSRTPSIMCQGVHGLCPSSVSQSLGSSGATAMSKLHTPDQSLKAREAALSELAKAFCAPESGLLLSKMNTAILKLKVRLCAAVAGWVTFMGAGVFENAISSLTTDTVTQKEFAIHWRSRARLAHKLLI
jgi:hypothetical protein